MHQNVVRLGAVPDRLPVTRNSLIGIDADDDRAAGGRARSGSRRRHLSSRWAATAGATHAAGAARAARAAIALLDRLASRPSQNGDAHVRDLQVRRNRIPVDILGIRFQVGPEAKPRGCRAHAQKRTPPNCISFCRHYSPFRHQDRLASGTDKLYPNLCIRAYISKQMLARPQVHSWHQYNFAASITMVFRKWGRP